LVNLGKEPQFQYHKAATANIFKAEIIFILILNFLLNLYVDYLFIVTIILTINI